MSNFMRDALREIIQKAIYEELITPREDSLPHEFKAEKWQPLFFLKDGRSLLSGYTYSTENETVEFIERCLEMCRQYPNIRIRYDNSPSVVACLGHEVSHGIPVPAKESK